MSIQGELNIILSPAQGTCAISSTRPVQIGRLFTDKPIEDTLKKLPLIFSICAKAHTISTVRAIESAKNISVDSTVESHREALVALENLREQSLRLLMDWPSHLSHLQEELDRKALTHVAHGIAQLTTALEPDHLLSESPKTLSNSISQSVQQRWLGFSSQLSDTLFTTSAESWLNSSINDWAEQQQTQTARFIVWLQQQEWKGAGATSLDASPTQALIDDSELVKKLKKDQEAFTQQPRWKGKCYEFSWFSRRHDHPVISQLSASLGNGLYTRMMARLIEVAELMKRLDGFFLQNILLQPVVSSEQGLAHTEAARGRLTHYVELDNQTIKKLIILAPTEWNFHPKGVAQQSLQHLVQNFVQNNGAGSRSELGLMNSALLKQQADLMIHAIDPCVGYHLHIERADDKAKVMT